MTKQELIQLAKRKHLMKTLILTMYSLIQRGNYDNVEDAMDSILRLFKKQERMIGFLKGWKSHLNDLILCEGLSILDLMENKSKIMP